MSATSVTRTNGPAHAKPWILENKSQGRFDVRRAAFTADLVEAEMRRIFDKSWLYVGHESEIPNNGDFVTRTVAGRPLVLVRSSDGMVRVLQNSCSHRGAEVCRERRGNSRLFVCPYHAWTFQNDGLLRGTSFPEGVSNIAAGMIVRISCLMPRLRSRGGSSVGNVLVRNWFVVLTPTSRSSERRDYRKIRSATRPCVSSIPQGDGDPV